MIRSTDKQIKSNSGSPLPRGEGLGVRAKPAFLSASKAIADERRHRLGFTLVELLVALTIAMVLTVVALPRVREGLQQNVASRSSTLVKGVFENARANAIRTGRPYGVILHRVKNEVTPNDAIDDPMLFATQGANYCKRLSFAQVAFDYRGDVEGATATFGMDTTPGGQDYQFLDFDNATAGLVRAHANNLIPKEQQLFGVGSVVRIGKDRLPVVLSAPPAGTQPPAAGFTRYVVASPFPVFPGQQVLSTGDQLAFLIETRPIPSPIASVNLPGKVVLDLAASGFSMLPTALSPTSINTSSGLPPILRPDPSGGSNPVRGYHDIIVMFSSSGYLDSIYIDQQIAPGVFSFAKVPATDALSFLIGEIDGVVLPQTVARFPAPRGNTTWPPSAVPASFDHQGRKLPNFANGDASWLSINPSSGKVILKSVALPLGVSDEATSHPELAATHSPDVLVRDRLLDSRRLTRGVAK